MSDEAVEGLVAVAAAEKSLEEIVEKGQYLDHLKKVNDVFYDQIKIADQKAAYLFTFMLALLVTSPEGRGVFAAQRYLTGSWAESAVSAVMAAAVLVTIVAAIMVVLPRRAGNGTSLYWGSWSDNRARFLDASRTGDQEFLTREYLGNVDNLSMIARRKFLFVNTAFRGLLVSVIAYVCLLALK